MKRLIFISAGLNILLLCVLLFVQRPSPPTVTGTIEKHTREKLPREQTMERTPEAEVNPNGPQPFDWRQIESEDYLIYVANLRSIKCPEKTIVDIILADVEKLFKNRLKQLETPGRFWKTADEAAADHLAVEHQRFLLLQEKRALLKTLVNTDLDFETLQEWYDEDDLGGFLGFLPDETAVKVLCSMKPFIDRFKWVHESSHGVRTPEDGEANLQNYSELMSELGKIISPSELEEGELRMVYLATSVFSPSRMALAKLNGNELRQLMRLKLQFAHPLRHEMTKASPAQSLLDENKYLEQALNHFGETRFYPILRTENRDFYQLSQFAETNGIGTDVALALHQIRTVSTIEAIQAHGDFQINPAQRRENLRLIEESTRAALEQLLGARFSDYTREIGDWYNRLEKR